eukprot:TRINITY_DN5214_c0_g1_i1.p2 TRINITY_DN5214_c0_g1~~TRINITY_DN5214_c0_g1_i1.p2  ORF type:complete len:135 (+),score=1.12 TRINITY_DN5214_c0_g1_i1:156-560(+)
MGFYGLKEKENFVFKTLSKTTTVSYLQSEVESQLRYCRTKGSSICHRVKVLKLVLHTIVETKEVGVDQQKVLRKLMCKVNSVEKIAQKVKSSRYADYEIHKLTQQLQDLAIPNWKRDIEKLVLEMGTKITLKER